MIKKIILICIASYLCLLLTGCTNRQTYDGLQAGKRNECLTLETDRLVRQCLEQTSTSFKEYEAERKALLEAE